MAEIKKSESPERLRDEIRGRLREEMTERLREEMEDAGKEIEFGKKRKAQVVENILDLLRTHGDDNLVFYAGTLHVKDLFAEFKEIKESGNKEGIKIDNITVYLPPLDRVICDFIDIMRGTHTRQTYMNSLRK